MNDGNFSLPMRRLGGFAFLAVVIAMTPTSRAADQLSYNRDVRPILSDKCFACHGPDENHREADLRLDEEESAKDSAIVAGDLESSEFVARILATDADTRMPPAESGKELTAEEIAVLKKWIASGAEYEPYWAYVPPRRVEPPSVKNTEWPTHWIDRFVLARLEKEGLQPSADADRVTLLRRVYFDLIGLPPTPQETESFLDAQDERKALAAVVDRLLASDRFGERMAMYWLDLVRYADTVGYHGDQDHSISPYRDYVIDAFNRDLPFDEFTREQLAGDLLPNPTIDQRVATGYNRLLQTSHEGGVQPKEYLAIYAADRVRNFSNVWLGATMGCCQCHDHKYDPYTAKDFYSLIAFFADVDEAQHFKLGSNALPTRRPPEIKVLSRQQRATEAELVKRLDSAREADEKQQVQSLEKELAALRASARPSMVTVSVKPREIRLLPRGNWLDDSGPVVTPAIPQFLGQIGDGKQRASRLDLANWLVDEEKGVGGFTARVMVNRIWYLFFGVGISNSLDDFGGQGEPPTHPELLDRLAVELLDNQWKLKPLIRQVVLSRTYRQSSVASQSLRTRDPNNRLFARQSSYRLPAETIRDNALAVSGLLVNRLGGRSVKPYQPTGYYRHLNFPKRTYKSDGGDNQWRRGVYVHWQRQFLHPMLRAFDAPSREECTAQRPRSNTPLAAMALLNDPTFFESARALAVRGLREKRGKDIDRLHHVFEIVLSRGPTEFERKTLLGVLSEARVAYAASPQKAADVMKVGLAKTESGPLAPQEIAAWTAVARVLLNLSETITRS